MMGPCLNSRLQIPDIINVRRPAKPMASNVLQQFYRCLDSLTEKIGGGKFKLLPSTPIFNLPLKTAGLLTRIILLNKKLIVSKGAR
jgi:hypothetical protein